MRRLVCVLICTFSLIASVAFAQPPGPGGMPEMGPMTEGSGPYAPAIVEGDSSLPDHTIYRPEDLSSFGK